jgi:di/tricarboxylate transporter
VLASPVLLLILVVAATLAFASERVAPDIVALCLLLVLMALGYVSPGEGFEGFSSDAVIILVAALVFTAGLSRSGVSRLMGGWLLRLTSHRPRLLTPLLTAAAALFSLVMNNIAAASVLLPGAGEAMQRRRISPSKVLMPLAFATQLGGMATLLTTSNIVVGEVLRQKGFRPFGLMDFLPVGGTLALIGLVYLLVFGERLLPESSETEERLHSAPARSLTDIYELGRRLTSVRILEKSPLAGTTLGRSGLANRLGAVVIAVVHPDGTRRRAPEASLPLGAGDILVLDGVPPDAAVLGEAGLETIRVKRPLAYLSSQRVALVEGVVAPRSSLAGKTLQEVRFRGKYGGVSVLSVWRNGGFLAPSELSTTALQFGDALLMQGPRTSLRHLGEEGDIVLLGGVEGGAEEKTGKTIVSVAILTATLILAAAFPSRIAPILFAGAVATVLAGCLTSGEAYRLIDWRSVVLVAAMLPLGQALTRSGAASLLADAFIRMFHAQHAVALLAAFAALTALLTQVLPGGAATPLIVAPIAISTALHAGANPRAFAMAVALATSLSMLTPFSHPVNVLVMGPGGYRFRDYTRLGIPLVLLMLAGIIALVPLWMGL